MGFVAYHTPWNSPGKNTGVGFHAFLQGSFLTQGLNPHLFKKKKKKEPTSLMPPALAGRFFTTSAASDICRSIELYK